MQRRVKRERVGGSQDVAQQSCRDGRYSGTIKERRNLHQEIGRPEYQGPAKLRSRGIPATALLSRTEMGITEIERKSSKYNITVHMSPIKQISGYQITEG
ncbi:hypothetical protein FKM82_014886 [Ascaphus truei]